MLVNTGFLVSKCLYSWLFLLGRHRCYSQLIWKEQHLSQQNSLFNIYSIPRVKKAILILPGTKAGKFECKQVQLLSDNDCNYLLFFSLLPLIEVSGIWWRSQNGSRNFSDLSHTASVNSQNDQCLNMMCDGNWHNKESFYPYWIIKNNQYIGRIDSLLIKTRKQGKSHIPWIIYLSWLVLSYQTAVLQ